MSPTFKELQLPDVVVSELARQMRTEPFPIQAAMIPDALSGRDVLGRAPTGSGKTLAFGLPTLLRVAKAKPKAPRALILSPTRELAEQIRTELSPLAKAVDRTVTAVYGGTSFGPQISALNSGTDILVACPGRLEDLIGQGKVVLNDVDIVVIDEADRMADMGFLPSVRRIVDDTSDQRQMMLFSATLDRAVQVLIDDYLTDPVSHSVGLAAPDLSKLEHRFWLVDKTERADRAAQVVDEQGSTIIFCRTRHGVDRVARQLKARGVKAAWIHGGRTQGQRNSALHTFTEGKAQALVATDVAARGIHVDDVACVIHYDPPGDEKDYVHRSGRTARAGGSGVVFSFLLAEQTKDARKLQQKLKLPGEIQNPPPLPGWVKANAEAWVASGAKSTRQRSPKNKTKTAGQSSGKKSASPNKANSKKPSDAKTAAATTSTVGNDEPHSDSTRKPRNGQAKSSRSGKKRPANRNGGRRKQRTRNHPKS
jgi:superfamily II DNA/RNA helicase